MGFFSDFFRVIFGLQKPLERKNDNKEPSGTNEGESWKDYHNREWAPDDHQFSSNSQFPAPPFPHFSSDLDEIRRSFDELFKLFGADNIPFFDPFIPFDDGNDAELEEGGSSEGRSLRDRMLKGTNRPFHSEDQIRDKMLRNSPLLNPSMPRKPEDKDFDADLSNGGDIDAILSQGNSSAQQPTAPSYHSYYRFSSTTTTRKPDGTIETRTITQDADGNKQETIEITEPTKKDHDLRNRFFKDHNLIDEDWVSKFFRW